MIAEADHDHDVPVVALSVMCRAAGAAGHGFLLLVSFCSSESLTVSLSRE